MKFRLFLYSYINYFFLFGAINIGYANKEVYYGIVSNNPRPLLSLLLGISFWLSILIGMLFLIIIWYTCASKWSVVIRRQMEHSLSFFPYITAMIIFLSFVIIFSSSQSDILWHWINLEYLLPSENILTQDPLLNSKLFFLNKEFLIIRLFFYLYVLQALSFILRRSSFVLDREHNASLYKFIIGLSILGLPICAITTTFAIFDLFMSLSYRWFSSSYGIWFFSTSIRSALSVVTISSYFSSKRNKVLYDIYNSNHTYYLACLSLGFTAFWAYISFSQYFIIYNSNLPEEIFWFSMRIFDTNHSELGYYHLRVYFLIFGYFIIPFFYLMSYGNKIFNKSLSLMSCLILCFHLFDLYFNIMPMQTNIYRFIDCDIVSMRVVVCDISIILGTGSLFVWRFIKSIKKSIGLPLNDPFIRESISIS